MRSTPYARSHAPGTERARSPSSRHEAKPGASALKPSAKTTPATSAVPSIARSREPVPRASRAGRDAATPPPRARALRRRARARSSRSVSKRAEPSQAGRSIAAAIASAVTEASPRQAQSARRAARSARSALVVGPRDREGGRRQHRQQVGGDLELRDREEQHGDDRPEQEIEVERVGAAPARCAVGAARARARRAGSTAAAPAATRRAGRTGRAEWWMPSAAAAQPPEQLLPDPEADRLRAREPRAPDTTALRSAGTARGRARRRDRRRASAHASSARKGSHTVAATNSAIGPFAFMDRPSSSEGEHERAGSAGAVDPAQEGEHRRGEEQQLEQVGGQHAGGREDQPRAQEDERGAERASCVRTSDDLRARPRAR